MKANTNEVNKIDRFVVYFKGEPVTRLNDRLIEKQGLSDEQVEVIKDLHVERIATEQLMKTAVGSNLKSLYREWRTRPQFELQTPWHFPEDARYHHFWEVPQCSCPVWDNRDALGTGYSTINLSCKVHGDSE